MITKDELEVIVGRLNDRIDKLENKVNRSIKKELFEDNEEIYDNEELMFYLKISERSIQRYHKEKKLPYFYRNGKSYHKRTDVMQFIKKHLY